MSLGLSRDSIANLQSLAQHSEKDDFTKAPSSANFMHLQCDDEDLDPDDLFMVDDIDEEEIQAVTLEPSNSNSAPLPSKFGPAETVQVVQDSSENSRSSIKSPARSSPGKQKSSASSPVNTGAYSGFDYHDDYYSNSYKSDNDLTKKKGENPLCCIFPFLKDPLESDDEYDNEDETNNLAVNSEENTESSQHSEPEISPSSSAIDIPENTGVIPSNATTSFAVTSETDSAVSSTAPPTSIDSEQSLQSENETPSQSPKSLKGILKHPVVKAPVHTAKSRKSSESLRNTSSTDTESAALKRRTILPKYMPSTRNIEFDDKDDDSKRPTKSVTFSSMARVLPVLARTEMSLYLKSMIWWQRTDYDDFKKAGRIIAKAMLQGGSEIWLETSNAWGKRQDRRSENKDGKNIGASSEYISALRKYGVNEEEKNIDDDDDVGNKWWCKIDHSRRGLEHIVSIEEGRQRQRLVNAAVTAVLEEQRRQRITRRDHKKISAISMQYTSWAKDLALAAGEADYEAVRSNFSSKKNRLSILGRKLLNAEQKAGQPCASFILSANPALTAEVLDSHTHRRKMMNAMKSGIVKDTNSSETKSDIAHQAAGFQYREASV